MGAGEYQKTDDRVAEAWTRGVQWFITRKIYPSYAGGSTNGNYTQFVVDMVDNFADRTNNGIFDSRDLCNGYTMAQIESTLKGSQTLNEWLNNIRSRINNTTEDAELQTLFNATF